MSAQSVVSGHRPAEGARYVPGMSRPEPPSTGERGGVGFAAVVGRSPARRWPAAAGLERVCSRQPSEPPGWPSRNASPGRGNDPGRSRRCGSGSPSAPPGGPARLGLPAGCPAPGRSHRRRRRHGRARRALGSARRRWCSGPLVGAAVGALAVHATATGHLRRSSRRRRRARLPALSAAVFRDAQVSLLAEQRRRRGPAVRRAAAGPDAVRRHRLRTRPGRARSAASTPPTRRTSASSPSLDALAGPEFDPAAVRPARCASSTSTRPGSPSTSSREWRLVGAPRLPALPHAGGPAARPGERADEPARGAARRPQPDRHDQRRRPARTRRGPRLDPLVRRQRRADLRRHLHDLPARRPRLRQRRLPAAAGELHRHPGAAGPARTAA